MKERRSVIDKCSALLRYRASCGYVQSKINRKWRRLCCMVGNSKAEGRGRGVRYIREVRYVIFQAVLVSGKSYKTVRVIYKV